MRQRTGSRAARTARVLGLLLLLPLWAGCGETHYLPEGALEIHNAWGSDETIVGLEIVEIVGPNFLAYDVYAPPGDSIVVDVFPSLYDIGVFWSDGGYAVWEAIEIRECCTTTIDAHR